MNNTLRISVVILTKNRAELLRNNLTALTGQLRRGDECVIINNGSTDHTTAVIRSFTGTLPIRTYTTRIKGFSNLYNYAIQKSRNPLLVFYDDDCVAAPGFIAAHRAAHRGKTPCVVQGQTYSIPEGNLYADIMADHYQNWLTMYMTKNGTLRTFDNKNLSLPKSILTKNGTFSPAIYRGGEDIELGFRLSQQGVPIRYVPHAVAYHHERDTIRAFVTQHIRFARSDAALARHMKTETTLVMFVGYKIYLHAISAVKREWRYIIRGNLYDAVRLPLIYLLLFILRIWGYATSR